MYIPLLPQGHKVKFKVTKVIAVFLPILLGFHLLGVLDCLPLVADTISLDMLVLEWRTYFVHRPFQSLTTILLKSF